MKHVRHLPRLPFRDWSVPHPSLGAAKGLVQTIWKKETETETVSMETEQGITEGKRWSRFRQRIQRRRASSTSTRSGSENPEVPKLADLVDHNIETIITLHMHAESQVSQHQRFLERLTAKLGRPSSFYLTLLVVFIWVILNSAAFPFHLRGFDPAPFAWLQGVIGLAALLMTILVLTTQNRQAKIAERRKHLDLQVNLVVEHKVSKLIALMEELRRDIPNVKNRYDQEAEIMAEAVDPQAMFLTLEATLEEVDKEEEQMVIHSEMTLDVETLLRTEDE